MVLNTQVLNSFIISLQVMYALLVAFLVIRSVFIVTWWVNESLSLPNQYSLHLKLVLLSTMRDISSLFS